MTARTVVAWIVRFGLVPGKGRYHNGLAPPSDTITSATRYVTANGAADVAFRCGGRVVAIVRHEPRDWAKLVEEHAALTARVASLRRLLTAAAIMLDRDAAADAAGYARGAADMRERSAVVAADYWSDAGAAAIRALPLRWKP